MQSNSGQTADVDHLPPPQPTPTSFLKPARPKMTTAGSRWLAAVFVLFGSLATAVSLGVAWWSWSTVHTGTATVISLLPGNSYWSDASGATGATTQTYISSGWIHVGQIYQTVLGLGVVTAIIGFIALLITLGWASGRMASPNARRFDLLLIFVSFVLSAAAIGTVAGGQPGAFNSDVSALNSGGAGGGCGASPNPCTSFWGSISQTGVTSSWGADIGWYLALVATVLFLFAFLLLWRARREP